MLQYAVFMSIKALRFLQLVASLETSCNRCVDHCCANGNCKRCLATAPLHLFVGAGHQSETREKESVRAIDRESEREEGEKESLLYSLADAMPSADSYERSAKSIIAL